MISKKKTEKLKKVFLIFFSAQLGLGAEVVLLKDGDVLTGRITKENENQIILNTTYGVVKIKQAEIKFLIRDEEKISPEQIKVAGKSMAARLIDETGDTRVYLGAGNRIIRVKKESDTLPAAAVTVLVKNPNRIELRAGSFFSTLPFVGLDEFREGKEKLKIRSDLQHNFALHAAYKRDLSRFWRVGAQLGMQYASLSTSEGDTSFKISETYKYNSFSTGLSAEILLLRGQTNEISAGIAGGYLYHSVDVTLAYPDTSSASAPARQQNLTGSTLSPYAGFFLHYGYRVTPRVQIVSVLSFRADFYSRVYQNLNGQTLDEKNLNESLKDAVLNDFSLRMNFGLELGVAYAW